LTYTPKPPQRGRDVSEPTPMPPDGGESWLDCMLGQEDLWTSIERYAATELAALRAELDELREWKTNTQAAYDKALNSPCPDGRHCTCVPALRAKRACEVCRDVEGMVVPTPATICGNHYRKVIMDMEAYADENEKLRAERDRLRVLLERARGVCTCHATMRPDIKCLSCAIAEELMK